MLSTSIFSSNGSVYHQSVVFGSNFELNKTELGIVGLPALTGSNAWSNLSSNLAVCPLFGKRLGLGLIVNVQIGAMIAHVALFWGPHARDCFKREEPDPHYKVYMTLFLESNYLSLQLNTGYAKI